MTRIHAGLAVAATAVLLGGVIWKVLPASSDDEFISCRQGQVAGGDLGGPFTLIDTKGQSVTDADVLTKPSLIYFGYTFCPDVCPMDMARNVEAVDRLADQGVEVTPVFISIDPDRDTPEALGDYAANLHPDLIALSGTADQIKAASQAYRTFYQKQDTGDEFYLMDHSTFTYLVLPGKGFVDFYRRDITSGQMAESVACYVQAGKAGG